MTKEMFYSEFVELYDNLFATRSKLEKEKILAEFLQVLAKEGESEWIYLLRGKVFADYDEREFGISQQLAIKAIGFSFGIGIDEIIRDFKKIGDLGEIAEKYAKKRKQTSLFSSKLTVNKVFEGLRKIFEVSGKGTVEGKLKLIAELLGNSSNGEAKYIVRTILSDLRVGVADAILISAIAEAFFASEKNEMVQRIKKAYDLCNDSALIFDLAKKGIKSIDKVKLALGRPVNVMLAVKVDDIKEAFRICGKPAAVEYKYDGFRVVISRNGDEIKLFTRRLENVTKQFPDIVNYVKNYIKGENFILDSEVVGFDAKTRKYKPFEAISQRIKRKYDIDKLAKELPVELNVFDVLFHNDENYMLKPFIERRKLLEKIIINEEWKIRLAKQIITNNEEDAMKFYREALENGEEGIMIKNINAEYQQGRKVGFMVKMKPSTNDLDLVILGAEYGTGKRAGWLTSYILGCMDKEGNFLEVGKVSSGLKEKEEEGFTYEQMSQLLRTMIIKETGEGIKVKPKVVVSVTYQNIQKSPSYDSGYALRFPRITAYRPDRTNKDIATLQDVKKSHKRAGGKA